MKDCRSVVVRMAQVFSVKTDSDLAEKLGIKRNTIASWKNRDSVPYEQASIVAEQKNISLDWLLAGIGPMHRGAEHASLDVATEVVPFEMDVELMGKIMSIFMEAAFKHEVTIPSQDIGEMAACIYQDLMTEWPDSEARLKALKLVTNIASSVTSIYSKPSD